MAIKVSVVVAVRNIGGDIGRNVKSMLAQTMPGTDVEVLYVDDGSTDDSLERLERAAAGHAQLRVIRSEHAGSYAGPRNLGLERARGEFVLFVDDDDFLEPDALRRLYEFAVEHEADIVQPKLVAGFPEAAHPVYRRTAARCGLGDSDLAWALTDHKLFRRSFLAERGLRFDESKRVLEDAVFAAEAYCATERIGVYADYPVYQWRSRHHAVRGAGGLHEVEAWFAHAAALMDVFASKLEAGPARDRALGRVYESEVHGQLSRRIDWVDAGQGFDAWFEAARKTVAAHMPSTVGGSLGVFGRVAAALLERGDRDRLADWYRLARAVRVDAHLERAEWAADGGLELDATARLVWADGSPIRFERVEGRVFLDRSLAERFALEADLLDVTEEFESFTGALSVSHREEGLRWPCPAGFERTLAADAEGVVTVAFKVSGAIRTEADGARERLSRGLWDAHLELSGFGLARDLRLGADREAGIDLRPAVLGAPARGVLPFFTAVKGELTIDVGKKARALGDHLSGRAVARAGDRALLLDAATSPSTAPVGATLLVEDGAGDWYEVPASVRPFEGRWRLELPGPVAGLAPGEGRLFARLDPGGVPPLPLGAVRIGPDGALALPEDLLVLGAQARRRSHPCHANGRTRTDDGEGQRDHPGLQPGQVHRTGHRLAAAPDAAGVGVRGAVRERRLQ